MRKALRNITHLLLVAAVLITSTGFVINKHTCRFSGKVDISINSVVGCGNSETESQANGCCELDSKVFKNESASLQKIQLAKVFQFAILPSFTLNFIQNPAFQTTEIAARFEYSSPPDSGRSITIQHCQFLI